MTTGDGTGLRRSMGLLDGGDWGQIKAVQTTTTTTPNDGGEGISATMEGNACLEMPVVPILG